MIKRLILILQLKLRGVHVEEEGTVTDPELIMEVRMRCHFFHIKQRHANSQVCALDGVVCDC